MKYFNKDVAITDKKNYRPITFQIIKYEAKEKKKKKKILCNKHIEQK